MKQFEKWLRGQSQIPAYPRYGSIDEDCAAGEGWKAAMEQVLLWGSDDDILFNKIKDEIYGA